MLTLELNANANKTLVAEGSLTINVINVMNTLSSDRRK